MRFLRRVARLVVPVGSEPQTQWCRQIMNADLRASIVALRPERLAAVEISGDLHAGHAWRTYEVLRYPDFDLCSTRPRRRYDVVICEQVLEHLPDPWKATRTLRALCKTGGHVIVSTPFLVRIHPEPVDYWRFTADGLRVLLTQAGLDVVSMATWGNRSCLRANLRAWVRYRPWHSLRNDPRLPLVVWAVARRPG
ncbi:MAG: class I SAM-dependent methyltransferase [Chloroflexota bacterium]